MEKLPNNINSILCRADARIKEDEEEKYGYNKYYHVYVINCNEDDKTIIKVPVPDLFRDVKTFSEEIIEENSDFVNGFKLVKLADNRYGYIRENDGKLLPFRYDVASNFNEYGLAMVAKRGHTTWINKDFAYLSAFINDYGKMMEEVNDEFMGFDGIFNFSSGKIPLSRVINIKGYHRDNIEYRLPDIDDQCCVSYLGINGELKKFYKYDCEESLDEVGETRFENGNNFNENDYSIDNNKVLFARGYYCTSSDFLKVCDQSGMLSKISQSIKSDDTGVMKVKK